MKQINRRIKSLLLDGLYIFINNFPFCMYGWRLPTYLFTFSHLLCVLFFSVALFCLFGVCRASTNITRPVYFELNFCTRHQNGQYQGKEKKSVTITNNTKKCFEQVKNKRVIFEMVSKQAFIVYVCGASSHTALFPEYIQLWLVLF